MKSKTNTLLNWAVFFVLLLPTLTSYGQGFDPCAPPGPGCSSGPAVSMFSPHCGDTLSALQPDTIIVAAMDASGKIDTTFNGPLSLSVNSGPGSMNGNFNVAFIKGLAFFNGVTVTAPGLYNVTFGGSFLPSLRVLFCLIRLSETPVGRVAVDALAVDRRTA